MRRLPTLLARTAIALIALIALGAVPLSAQVITTAVAEGDALAGVGTVTRIDNLAVNDLGEWVVEVDTDNADTNQDGALVKNGALLLREGQALPAPPNATLDSFDAVTIDDNGDSGWNFFLDGTSGTGDDSGIYFNDALVLQEGTISGAAGFSPGTPYIGFFETKVLPGGGNRILVMASVDDPAIASSVDRAIVAMDHDGAGNLVSETVLWKEGDILPGQVEGVNEFGTGPHDFAMNDGGQVLYFADVGASSTTDGCIYLDDTLLAQEGSPSPIGGRNYELLSSRGRDLSNGGAWVTKANLDGDAATDEILVRNGAVFRQEGDTLPDIAPFLLTTFGTGSGPVQIDQAGNVLWFGDWDDPDTDIDTGLFLNDELIVQEGVTTVDGVIIDTIQSGQDAFMLSENGMWAMFEAVLINGIEGAFLIDLSGPVPVRVSGLAATVVERSVEIRWSTSIEIAHAGFHVYRSRSLDGPWARLDDELVQGRGEYVWADATVEGDHTYYYRIGAVDVSGAETLYGPVTVTTPVWNRWATRFDGAQPNPFRRSTALRFSLAAPGRVDLTIHDVAGRRVADLSESQLLAGEHAIDWNGRDEAGREVPAGVYFVRLRSQGDQTTSKVVRIGGR